MMGTPRYMAPEQIQGEQVGSYSDLYSIVVMMYEQLSGKHPFDHPELNHAPEVKGMPAPFRMSWHHINTEISPLLELPSLWLHFEPALQKRPFERAKDARLLRDHIKRWLSEHPQDRVLLVPIRRPQSFYDPKQSQKGQDHGRGSFSTKVNTIQTSANRFQNQLSINPHIAYWGMLTVKCLIVCIALSFLWRFTGSPSIPLVDPYLTGFMMRILYLFDTLLSTLNTLWS